MLKSKTFKTLAAAAVLSFAGVAVSVPTIVAHDDKALPTVSKRENVSYTGVLYIDFKPGKREAAVSLIYDHFLPASNAGGGGFFVVEYLTGSVDVAVVFPMPGGPGQLEWACTQNCEGFWKALAEQEGGEEAALALFQEYLSYVDSSDYRIGYTRNMDDGNGDE